MNHQLEFRNLIKKIKSEKSILQQAELILKMEEILSMVAK